MNEKKNKKKTKKQKKVDRYIESKFLKCTWENEGQKVSYQK